MPQISQRHMREYETLYVLKADLEDEAAVSFIGKMKDLVEKKGGKHLQVTNWGRKKLAWERDRQQKGMYVHHRYLAQPTMVKDYERTLKLDEACILRQTIVLDKSVDPDTKNPEADTLEPPVTKEARREDRDDRGPRDRGDRGDRDRGERGDRDRGDRDRGERSSRSESSESSSDKGEG